MAWSYAEKGAVFGLIVGIFVMILLIKYNMLGYTLFCFNSSEGKKACLSYNSIFPLITAVTGTVIGIIADKITKKEEEDF